LLSLSNLIIIFQKSWLKKSLFCFFILWFEHACCAEADPRQVRPPSGGGLVQVLENNRITKSQNRELTSCGKKIMQNAKMWSLKLFQILSTLWQNVYCKLAHRRAVSPLSVVILLLTCYLRNTFKHERTDHPMDPKRS
jgi:hypothetical protein